MNAETALIEFQDHELSKQCPHYSFQRITSKAAYERDAGGSYTLEKYAFFYHYDMAGNILQETDSSGNIISSFAYDASGHPVAFTQNLGQGQETFFLHANARGDVVMISDDAMSWVKKFSYDPWGKVTSETSRSSAYEGLSCPYGYAGYFRDQETGLYYMPARYYSPSLRRFLTKDPHPGSKADPLTLNPYQYCRNNPINNVDPSGQASTSLAMAIALKEFPVLGRLMSDTAAASRAAVGAGKTIAAANAKFAAAAQAAIAANAIIASGVALISEGARMLMNLNLSGINSGLRGFRGPSFAGIFSGFAASAQGYSSWSYGQRVLTEVQQVQNSVDSNLSRIQSAIYNATHPPQGIHAGFWGFLWEGACEVGDAFRDTFSGVGRFLMDWGDEIVGWGATIVGVPMIIGGALTGNMAMVGTGYSLLDVGLQTVTTAGYP